MILMSVNLCAKDRSTALHICVDINPLAVEMAKLSLWLLTLAKDKPFEFLTITFVRRFVGRHPES